MEKNRTGKHFKFMKVHDEKISFPAIPRQKYMSKNLSDNKKVGGILRVYSEGKILPFFLDPFCKFPALRIISTNTFNHLSIAIAIFFNKVLKFGMILDI